MMFVMCYFTAGNWWIFCDRFPFVDHYCYVGYQLCNVKHLVDRNYTLFIFPVLTRILYMFLCKNLIYAGYLYPLQYIRMALLTISLLNLNAHSQC